MSSTYSIFFTKEITCLPSLLDKYLGKYYNNAVGNAITWFLFIWLLIHYLFDKFAIVSNYVVLYTYSSLIFLLFLRLFLDR